MAALELLLIIMLPCASFGTKEISECTPEQIRCNGARTRYASTSNTYQDQLRICQNLNYALFNQNIHQGHCKFEFCQKAMAFMVYLQFDQCLVSGENVGYKYSKERWIKSCGDNLPAVDHSAYGRSKPTRRREYDKQSYTTSPPGLQDTRTCVWLTNPTSRWIKALQYCGIVCIAFALYVLRSMTCGNKYDYDGSDASTASSESETSTRSSETEKMKTSKKATRYKASTAVIHPVANDNESCSIK